MWEEEEEKILLKPGAKYSDLAKEIVLGWPIGWPINDVCGCQTVELVMSYNKKLEKSEHIMHIQKNLIYKLTDNNSIFIQPHWSHEKSEYELIFDSFSGLKDDVNENIHVKGGIIEDIKCSADYISRVDREDVFTDLRNFFLKMVDKGYLVNSFFMKLDPMRRDNPGALERYLTLHCSPSTPQAQLYYPRESLTIANWFNELKEKYGVK